MVDEENKTENASAEEKSDDGEREIFDNENKLTEKFTSVDGEKEGEARFARPFD